VIGEVTFGVIGLLFLFADIRTFASTFQQTFFGAPTMTQAILATAVFATSFLGVLVAWRLGPRRALGVSGAVFALATFLCTASRNTVGVNCLLFTAINLTEGGIPAFCAALPNFCLKPGKAVATAL